MSSYSSFIFEKNKANDNKVAIVDKNGFRETTLKQLKEMSFSVANYAKSKKLSGVVPVCMYRCAETVATILGLNYAGVGVAPLSYDTPRDRINIIEKETENTVFTIENFNDALKFDSNINFDSDDIDGPAIVVFTSGSTGTPKGVMLNDDAIIKGFVRSSERFFCHKSDDIALQTTSFSFVAIVLDVFAPLYAGITLHILPDIARKDSVLMTDYINKYGITTFFTSPKVLKLLGEMKNVRKICVGGERLSNFSTDKYSLINVYGMSEMCGIALRFPVDTIYDNTPIGIEDENFQCYIVDENGNLSDYGELCVSGAIASGYYNNPELSAKTFTENPYLNKKGHETLLHTGDIVKRSADGNLIYLNRSDFMIKINGQRVEPNEAEIAIKHNLDVKDAVVLGFTEPDGRTYLCAYYESKIELNIEHSIEILSKILPTYMIPSYFVHMEHFPLNQNGKLDRKALTPPNISVSQNEYISPIGATETLLCEAFQTILKIEKIGTNDDFIALGGDSIKAMEIVRACKDADITAHDVLKGKTPKGISAILDKKTKSNTFVSKTKKDLSPLTDSQMGIYLQCMIKPDSVMYNIPIKFTFERTADMTIDNIKSKIDYVISLHSALYSSIKIDEDKIFMCRHNFPSNGICIVFESDFSDEFEKDFVKPFDLLKSPLCRVNAVLTETNLHIYADFHHIVCDGTSVKIIAKELAYAFAGKEIDKESIDAFSVYYNEQNFITDDDKQIAKEYFSELLCGNEIDSNLLYDEKPKDGNDYASDSADLTISLPDLNKFLRNNSITESSFFMGVFGYALAKMTGQNESVFAVAESGRQENIYDNTVSMFVKTLPVIYNFDETKKASHLLKIGQEQFFNSVNNDCYPFGNIVTDNGITADVMFVYQSDLLSDCNNFPIVTKITPLTVNENFSNLAFSVWKDGNDFRLLANYRKSCYKKKTISRFLKLFENISMSFADDLILKDIPLLSDEDKQDLTILNNTENKYDKTKNVVDLFKESVNKYPQKTALICKNKTFTYSEIDKITDKISAYIKRLNIKKGETVSVLIPRNEYMLIASIGILKSGAVYQPLDPSYPTERLSFMCKDADSKLLIAERELLPILPDYDKTILCLDEIDNLTDDSYFADINPEDGFVLLYTSGTTGLPKGCMITHKNVSALMNTYITLFDADDSCVSGAYASYGFDAHLTEIYPVITVGGTLHIITEDIRLDLPSLKNYYEVNGVTHTVMTTQIARQFACEYPDVKGLRYIISGGEKLATVNPPKSYTLMNCYGPTEATVFVTWYPVKSVEENIPIGKAIPNIKLYVVDNYGRELPIGAPGELIVFGPQVSKGYLNRPDKTADVFIENTFDSNFDNDYKKGYKTGDICRFLDDGNLQIIGRRDMQVKIRGFRIELSEIESVIREFEGISDATVITVDDINDGKCIHAYIVAKEKININALNQFIKERKPAYMVPSATMQIDSIPLTPNFKVDKRKLPPITGISSEESYNIKNAQLSDLEQKLSAILSEIVGHNRFGIETDFVSAGITSITSIRLAVRIFKEFGFHITSKDILDGGTILSVENSIVAHLLQKHDEDDNKNKTLSEYPLTSSQLGVYLDSLSLGMDTYLVPMLLEIDSKITSDNLKQSIITAIKAHPSMLCYIYPDKEGNPKLYPAPNMEFDIEEFTLTSLDIKPTVFEFNKSPLFRFRIIHFDNKLYLFIEVHHIIADGESLKILANDIKSALDGNNIETENYTAFDITLDEQRQRSSKDYDVAKSYYDSVFRGVSNDYLPNSDINSSVALGLYDLDFVIEKNIVKSFCQKCGISENILFSSAFAITLARFTSHSDALFATVHNGRGDPRTENLFSMTVKTIPFYIDIPNDISTKEFLSNFDNRLNKLKKYDLYSFADAVKDYEISAETMFVYQGDILNDISLGRLIPTKTTAKSPKMLISFEVKCSLDGYNLHCEFNSGKYSDKFIEGFTDAYKTCILELISKNKICDIDICSKKAFDEFNKFNDTSIDIKYRPAYRLIEDTSNRLPSKKAIVSGNEYITYRQFDYMANDLAREIYASGIPNNSTISLLIGRTKEIYIAQYAVLKSANAFICLSTEYPDERINFILDDSNTKAIITTHKIAETHRELLRKLNLPIFYADDIKTDTTAKPLNLDIEPEKLSYMIYTSGSTGKPKGVTVTQLGLVNISDANLKNDNTLKFVNESTVSTAVSAFTFDASVMEGYVAFANGSTVCIAGEDDIHNPAKFCDLCLKNNVTSLFGTPSFLTNLSDCEEFSKVAQKLKTVLAGGEEFTTILLKKLYELNPSLTIFNGYGPSETTITCSCKQLKIGEKITIGTPFANTKLYCLDAQNHILPMGALGELTVVGDGVGNGYLNRDDLTKKAFITVNGEKAFKTGDLAVIAHSNEVEFHGRIDNQIKIRGLRVELGEIENVINTLDGIKTSVVIAKGDGENKYLSAYFTANRTISNEEIIGHISKKLAKYMIPRAFCQLENMPITPNGKIDKKALAKIENIDNSKAGTLPTTETEKTICGLFATILKLNEVFADDNFFDIGGNSLTASRVVMQLKSKGFEIEYQTLFDYQTPKALAKFIDKKSNNSSQESIQNNDGELSDKIYHEVLKSNTLQFASQVQREPLGDIVLTGAVGFLGIHVLWSLLHNEKGHIYCLVRKGGFPNSRIRLDAISFYYFSVCLTENFYDRITIIDADITSENISDSFKGISFDTIINCAACVKHYCADDSIEFVNVHGVENLISLAKEKNARLIQISTTSVAGVHTEETLNKHITLNENQIFMADDMNNKYIISKYHAEICMLSAIKEGLDGKIIRVGNLMGRHFDGEFQMNMGTNAFLNALKGFATIGKSPLSHSTDPMEFSPVDCTADAIVALAGTNKMFTVFHANSRFTFDEMLLMNACNRCGLKIIPTEDKAYYEEYYRLLADSKINKYLSALVTNDRPDLHSIICDNTFTANILYQLGFSWPFIDDAYLERVISSLRDIGFFEREPNEN